MLGRNISELREAAGMSQETLASLCGINRSYLSQIENGRVNVSLAIIIRIANTFEVEAVDLLTRY